MVVTGLERRDVPQASQDGGLQCVRGLGPAFAARAQRHLFNRVIGQLHHCLHTRQPFDEQQAFTSSSADLAVAA
ncbi:hypothetical protein [Streptomyces sp. BK340]|uniref:hypothetical protein n=1 Tax=Streptomyces sp. BK340 TaxID=2572903 RepID=UPI0011A44EB7